MNVVMYEKLLKNIVFRTVFNQFSLLYLVAEKLNTLILCQEFMCIIIVVCCCLTTGEIWNQRTTWFGEKNTYGLVSTYYLQKYHSQSPDC